MTLLRAMAGIPFPGTRSVYFFTWRGFLTKLQGQGCHTTTTGLDGGQRKVDHIHRNKCLKGVRMFKLLKTYLHQVIVCPVTTLEWSDGQRNLAIAGDCGGNVMA